MSNKYISDQSNQFKNKIIIVTGSTQGSGAETAKLLASRGAKGITICGRNNKNGNKVKSEIESIGAECLYVQADLEKLEDCKKIVSETDKKFSTVDSFINVAAFTERGTILSTTEENYDKNFNVRNFQERAAINAPIQGSASEIMRLAMIRIDKKLEEEKSIKSKMLLQIHDELIFEVKKSEIKKMMKIIKDEMISVANSDYHSFSIPLTVDINSGNNWGELH